MIQSVLAVCNPAGKPFLEILDDTASLQRACSSGQCASDEQPVKAPDQYIVKVASSRLLYFGRFDPNISLIAYPATGDTCGASATINDQVAAWLDIRIQVFNWL